MIFCSNIYGLRVHIRGECLLNRADPDAATQQYTQCLRCDSECLDIELGDP